MAVVEMVGLAEIPRRKYLLFLDVTINSYHLRLGEA
jgi:hypothetical protein